MVEGFWRAVAEDLRAYGVSHGTATYTDDGKDSVHSHPQHPPQSISPLDLKIILLTHSNQGACEIFMLLQRTCLLPYTLDTLIFQEISVQFSADEETLVLKNIHRLSG